MKIKNDEWNVLSKLTSVTHMDNSFDIWTDEDGNDCFMDFEEDRLVPVEEGLSWIYEGIAYPPQHDGLSREECETLVGLFKHYRFGDEEYYKWLLSEEE